MLYVSESLVIHRDGKLVALIHPDYDELAANGIEEADIDRIMKENIDELNTMIPNYSKITRYILMKEEFEKTPKKSIKRFLYQNVGE